MQEENDFDTESINEFKSNAPGKSKVLKAGIAYAIVLIIGLAGGVFLGSREPNLAGSSIFSNVPLLGDGLSATPDASANMTDFWKVWNALNTYYVVTHASSTIPTNQQKVWGAIEGLTASYGDPYTVFFPPVQAKQFQDNIQGTFGGIGLEIDTNPQGVLEVIAPLKGTPAAAAGFQPGDLIIAIDGKSTQGVSSDDAVNLIRGPIGSTVTLTVVRSGKQLSLPVTRETIQVPEIDYGLNKTTGVYRISLFEFTQNSDQLFTTAFEAFKKSGSKELIIDLRGNPGGYLQAAVSIASHFLPKGTNIVTEDYEGKQSNDVLTSSGTNDAPAGTKVVILIDGGSASASEILSGALHDNKVATLVGTRSFGKGSVQELVNIDGGSLKVTVARWLTPAGINIMASGIMPDITATTTAADIAAGKDPGMARATQFLQTGH